MTVTRHGVGALPGNPPVVRKRYTPAGETVTGEWDMDHTLTDAKYDEIKGLIDAGQNIASVDSVNNKGRGQLIVAYGRDVAAQNPDLGYGSDVSVIEEMYASEVLVDLSQAPYFSQSLSSPHPLATLQTGKNLPLSDEQVAFVRLCVEESLSHTEITAEAQSRGYSTSYEYASWTTGMKEYHYLLTHGVETHPMNAFIFRRTVYGVRKSVVLESITDGTQPIIGYVVSKPPAMLTDMQLWIAALPAGEWRYLAPRVQSIKVGKRSLDLEWQYAEKWPISMGGTFNYTAP